MKECYSHKFVDIGYNWYCVRVTWMMMVGGKEQCGESVAFGTGRALTGRPVYLLTPENYAEVGAPNALLKL